jgi:Cys-rich protein (TIGR01571 family)
MLTYFLRDPVALAQVMTRMRLTWMGEPGSVQQVAKTFKMVVGIFVLYMLVNQILNIIFYAMYPQFQDAGDYETAETLWAEAPAGAFILHYTRELIEFIFWLYILLATCRVRRNVREQYEIPEDVCAGCEDCCCAFWCQCCTTMQMMRHTADYDNYPAVCCTETGLPLSVGVNNV